MSEEVQKAIERIRRLKAGEKRSVVYKTRDWQACRVRENQDHEIAADELLRRLDADEAERARLQAIHDKLKEIVCTEGVDAGVVLLSEHATFHNEERDGRTVSCYDNEYFSPLGDALMELHFMLLRALGITPEKAK